MEASLRFNAEKHVGFASYAKFRVRGAILDSLRASDWAPRELRRKGRAVKEAFQTLSARLGRAPLEDQVADELKISLKSYQNLRSDLNGVEIGTLHRTREDGSENEEIVLVPSRPEDDPLFCCMRGQIEKRLSGAIASLPEQERLVTTLYFYDEMSRNEIGLALGLNGNKVSQIRASAITHLRAALSDHPKLAGGKVTYMQPLCSKAPPQASMYQPAA